MTEEPAWTPLGEVDYDRDVAEGFIQLSKGRAKAAGDHSVLAVRCHSDDEDKPAPSWQLKVKVVASSLKPVVSNTDYVRLRTDGTDPNIEARKLTFWEATKRIGARITLPAIVAVAALAALVGILFSELKDAMDIVTASLTIPATFVAVVKAIKEG